MSSRQLIQRFVVRHRWGYLCGLAALLLASWLATYLPKLLGTIADRIAANRTDGCSLLHDIIFFAAVAAALFVLKYTYRTIIMGNSRKLECYIRAKIYEHLQLLPVAFYNKAHTGELISYMINDLNALRTVFAFGIVFTFEGIVVNIISVFLMFATIDARLTLITLLPVFVSILAVLKMRGIIFVRFKRLQAAFSKLTRVVQENIGGIRIIKTYAQEAYEIEKMNEASKEKREAQLGYVKASTALPPLFQLSFGISTCLAFIVGGRLIAEGRISIGQFIAFNTYLGMLALLVARLGKIIEVWQMLSVSVNRIDRIFRERPEVDGADAVRLTGMKGSIRFNDVSFRYAGQDRGLKNISFDIRAGQKLGIIGKSGSGKTTLVHLLLRFFPVEDSKIFIDGIDINRIDRTALRDSIACVLQDHFLFNATIRDNIAFFDRDYSEEQVKAAAKLSGIYANVMDFPGRFDTEAGERGSALSGGQRQRISIARALIKKAPILILDDSLSAVDVNTEREVLANIASIARDKTTIIIAHRISSVMHADRILVMDDGAIVEQGNHQSLMALKGEYYQIYHSQSLQNSYRHMELAQ